MSSTHYHGRSWVSRPDARFAQITTEAGAVVFDLIPGSAAAPNAPAKAESKTKGRGGKESKSNNGGKAAPAKGKGAGKGGKGGSGAQAAASGAGTSGPPNTKKRDHLQEIAEKWQARWASDKEYEADAPAIGESGPKEGKFLVTFPYPYMNGRLHLGHAFSITKAEFAARF